MALPTFKYGITNLVAERYQPEYAHLSLQSSHDTLIVQYRIEDNSGNWHFDYLIEDDPNAVLEKDGWKVKKIYTVSAFTPQEIVFKITDPYGMTEKEIGILRKNREVGTAYYIAFKGLYEDAINKGLSFFATVSGYKSWYHFLVSKDAGEFTTEALFGFISKEKESQTIIDKLKTENEQLKERLFEIHRLTEALSL